MRVLYAVMCALYLVAFGCALSATQQVEVLLPSLPPGWESYPGEPWYFLSYSSRENGEVELELPSGTEAVTVSLEKGNNVPVICTPCFGDGEYSLRSAGALYPADCTEQGTLPLSWDGGFLADLILSLNRESVLVEYLNTTRMAEVIQEAGEGDPWSLDKERIIQTLRFYSFRQDYVTPLPDRALDIELSEGIYLWNNPCLSSFQAETTGIHEFDSLYEGEHILFPSDGSEAVRIVITDKEWFIFYPGRIESGNW